ncbi:maker294, partial [Drosophila busckii]
FHLVWQCNVSATDRLTTNVQLLVPAETDAAALPLQTACGIHMKCYNMTDPSIGSSSPHWANLISSNNMPTFVIESTPHNVTYNVPLVPPAAAQQLPLLMSGQMSPYAPVFHPMGSYASHLMALEQAAQINPVPAPPPPPRPMDPNLEDFYDRAPISEILLYNGQPPAHVQTFLYPVEANLNLMPQQQPQQQQPPVAAGPIRGPWWSEQHVEQQSQVLAPPTPTASPTFEGWRHAHKQSMDVAKTLAAAQHIPELRLLPPRDPWFESEAKLPAPRREWWQAAAFKPKKKPQAAAQPPVQLVHPRKADCWLPYGYVPQLAVAPTAAPSFATKVKVELPAAAAAAMSTLPLQPTGMGTEAGGNNISYSFTSSSSSSSIDALSDFPSFEEFASQVSDCSLSSSEYMATLRNLIMRAHNLMLPLLRGRFAKMSQAQMAAYTTALLGVTPLHPSLFLPTLSTQSSDRPWLDVRADHLPPPSHPPLDLPRTKQRPMRFDVGTQTEYHCWCMHISMYPPPPLPPHVPPPPCGAHFAGPPPPPQPNGPCLMAPCASFWGRPMAVPVHPHARPHAFPHAPQMQRAPTPASHYGYRFNTYSLPYNGQQQQ